LSGRKRKSLGRAVSSFRVLRAEVGDNVVGSFPKTLKKILADIEKTLSLNDMAPPINFKGNIIGVLQ